VGQGGPCNDKLEAEKNIQAIFQQAASRDKICCHLLQVVAGQNDLPGETPRREIRIAGLGQYLWLSS